VNFRTVETSKVIPLGHIISVYSKDILTGIKIFLGYQLHPFRTALYFSIFMGCQVRERDEVSERMDSSSKLTHLVALEDFISSFSVTLIS
jgi:hypothetical protein